MIKPTAPKSIEKRTRAGKAAFLRAFSDDGSVTRSAYIAGIDRTTHYAWLAGDAKYKSEFSMATLMAKDAALDELLRLGRIGEFKPLIYKGRFQYATRQRTLCTLTDGTTAFEDELPEGSAVILRQTVAIRGEMLGVYKRSSRALAAAAAIMMPEKYGTRRRSKGKKDTHSSDQ
jgi:hypothetical protein